MKKMARVIDTSLLAIGNCHEVALFLLTQQLFLLISLQRYFYRLLLLRTFVTIFIVCNIIYELFISDSPIISPIQFHAISAWFCKSRMWFLWLCSWFRREVFEVRHMKTLASRSITSWDTACFLELGLHMFSAQVQDLKWIFDPHKHGHLGCALSWCSYALLFLYTAHDAPFQRGMMRTGVLILCLGHI